MSVCSLALVDAPPLAVARYLRLLLKVGVKLVQLLLHLALAAVQLELDLRVWVGFGGCRCDK